jgi:thermolabile hemolysin
MRQLKTAVLALLCSAAAFSATPAFALGSSTYTYLRCFYRVDTAMSKPKATYVWGLNPNGSYYKVYGNWWKDGLTSWENMFYSNTSQNDLKAACQNTLAAKGINRAVEQVAGADTSLSLNYTIWTNDSATQGTQINKMIVLGDSLSDNQNLWNATQWQMPNQNSWFMGHFSNGHVWDEYAAENLKLPMYNWAVAGAAADSYIVIPGVLQQADSVITYMASAPNYRYANTLFTVMIGGNDIVNYGRSVDSILSAEQQGLEKLINAGARNILLMNLPDLSRAPVFQLRGDGVNIANQVAEFNRRLPLMRDALQAKYGSALNIKMYDTKALVNDMFNFPAVYGVTNTTQSCLNINTDSTTNYLSSQTLRSNCSNPDSFIFWDTLHPTTHTHKVMADSVSAFVRANYSLAP